MTQVLEINQAFCCAREDGHGTIASRHQVRSSQPRKPTGYVGGLSGKPSVWRGTVAGKEEESCRGAGMKDIQLITEAVLGSFAELVYHNQRRAYRLWLITPWLSYDDTKGDALRLIHEALKNTQCSLIVITRPPTDVRHQYAIDLLRTLQTTVYLCQNLHAKLYILECDGFRAAILGSPNLTVRANRLNREIAVEFKTVVDSGDNDVSTIVSELTEYASALRGEDDVQLM